MVFSAIIIVIIAIIAYFHYAQGLFSAAISAFCALLAAVIAVSYHETVISMLLKGAVANMAEGMMLCGLFALSYILLRLIFDKAVPGNVRFPLMVDKIGAAVMGIFAGLFASGVFALAAGSLPFGASLAGYARYSVGDRNVIVPGSRSNTDAYTSNEIKDANLNDSKTGLDPSKRAGLIIPVDDMVAGLVGQLSAGALSNGRPLAAIHPDWPTELFGQRAGVQVGTKRVLLNLPSLEMVRLEDVYKLDSAPEIDAEFKDIRDNKMTLVPEKGDTLKAGADETLLVTRVNFTNTASDEDGKVRVSPMSVRLVAWQDKGGVQEYMDYYPIGTLEEATVLFRNKPDDPLIVNGGKSVDFVFKVPRDAVYTDASAKPKELEIKPGVFIEVKRMAQMDLGGKAVKGPPPFSKEVEVIRKPLEAMKNMPHHGDSAGGSESAGQSSEQSAASPLQISAMKVSNKLFSAVFPGAFNGDENVSFKSGTGSMKAKKFQKLSVNPDATTKELAEGEFPVTDLYLPDGKKMVQVVGKPAGDDQWAWGNLPAYDLVDSTGNKYKPNGAAAEVRVASVPKMVANYDSDGAGQAIGATDGRPTSVYLFFNVPDGTQIKELQFNGQTVYAKGLKVP